MTSALQSQTETVTRMLYKGSYLLHCSMWLKVQIFRLSDKSVPHISWGYSWIFWVKSKVLGICKNNAFLLFQN